MLQEQLKRQIPLGKRITTSYSQKRVTEIIHQPLVPSQEVGRYWLEDGSPGESKRETELMVLQPSFANTNGKWAQYHGWRERRLPSG